MYCNYSFCSLPSPSLRLIRIGYWYMMALRLTVEHCYRGLRLMMGHWYMALRLTVGHWYR